MPTLEAATHLLADLDSHSAQSPDLTELRRDFLDAAVRYAHLRAEWALATPDDRLAMDATRTRAHDALIDRTNILARYMDQIGADASWCFDLGQDRKTIGDFACLVHAALGISAR